jgi:hypothetical protein
MTWWMPSLDGSNVPRRTSLISGGLHPRTFTNLRQRTTGQDDTGQMTTGIGIPNIDGVQRIATKHHRYLALHLCPGPIQTPPSALPRTPLPYLQAQVTDPEVLFHLAVIAILPHHLTAVPTRLTITTRLLLAIETAAVDAVGIKSIDTPQVVIQSHPSNQFLEHYLVEMVIVARA